MRGHLLSKAKLQDAAVLLRKLNAASGASAFLGNGPSLASHCATGVPFKVSRSSHQRSFTTACLASQVSTADEMHSSSSTSNTSNSMDFPGGRVPFTDQLRFEGGPITQRPPLSCYRTLDSKGMPDCC